MWVCVCGVRRGSEGVSVWVSGGDQACGSVWGQACGLGVRRVGLYVGSGVWVSMGSVGLWVCVVRRVVRGSGVWVCGSGGAPVGSGRSEGQAALHCGLRGGAQRCGSGGLVCGPQGVRRVGLEGSGAGPLRGQGGGSAGQAWVWGPGPRLHLGSGCLGLCELVALLCLWALGLGLGASE